MQHILTDEEYQALMRAKNDFELACSRLADANRKLTKRDDELNDANFTIWRLLKHIGQPFDLGELATVNPRSGRWQIVKEGTGGTGFGTIRAIELPEDYYEHTGSHRRPIQNPK